MSFLYLCFRLVSDLIKRLARHMYWLYNISRIKGVYKIRIFFPVICEGRGNIDIGNNSQLQKEACFKIARGARLTMGKNCHIEKNTSIAISVNASLIINNSCTIGEGTSIYINNNWNWGSDIAIARHCQLFAREAGVCGKLLINDGCHIADFTLIDVTDDVTIEKNVAIGPNTTIYTHDHKYTTTKAAWKGELIRKPVFIGEGAWIGSRVTILPGIKIGKFAVIAAGTVVTKDVPDYSLHGGVPAKLLKKYLD